MDAHFPDFAYILNIKFKKQLDIFKKKVKYIKKIKNTILFRIQFSISLCIFNFKKIVKILSFSKEIYFGSF
jgi:hypothetical protein